MHIISAYLLQYRAQLGLVLGASSFSFEPQQQLWFPVGFESQQVDNAFPQGLLGRRGHTAIPPAVGRLLIEAAVRRRRRSWPLVQLDTFT